MEIKVYNDTVTAAETICDTRVELPVETELLIPDYLPQVFKIVKCMLSLVVLQKQVSAARLTLEGYLRLVVFYQSDTEESLCQTEQKLPFSRQVELKAGEYFGAEVRVSGETEYVNCRAVNQRRVDVRGAFALDVSVSAQAGSEIITALSDGGVQQKNTTLRGIRTVALQEKLITVEEPLTFAVEPEMILHIDCAGEVQETKLLAGKAVLKGEVTATIVYRTAGKKELETLSKALPFNEILEAEGVEETCRCIAFAQPAGCTVLADDEGKNSLSVTTVLQLKAYREAEVLAVCDAFSTEYDTELTLHSVAMEQEVESFTQQAEAVAEGPLPDAEAQVVDVMATVQPPELLQQGDVCAVRGRVLLHMLCRNALGEIDCYDKPCEYTLPGTYHARREELFLTAQAALLDASAQRTPEGAKAAVHLRVSALVTRRVPTTVLEQIVCNGPRERKDDGVALRIYYAQAGEALFDVARRYAIAPQTLAQTNSLAGDTVTEKAQLLIPAL